MSRVRNANILIKWRRALWQFDMTKLYRSQLIMVLLLTTLTIAHAQQTGSVTIEFQVVDFSTAQPLHSVSVSLVGQQPLNATTNVNGTASLKIPSGTYTLTISKSSCTQLGPQPFTVDQTAPTNILVKLQCQQASTQLPTENPSVQTDKAEYHYNETIKWNATGFAPGAYLQACIGTICGGVVQADRFGNASGIFVIETSMTTGTQTLTIQNITTGRSTQTQLTLSP